MFVQGLLLLSLLLGAASAGTRCLAQDSYRLMEEAHPHVAQEARQRFWNASKLPGASALFLRGADAQSRPGGGTDILFRQSSDFLYLTGVFDLPGAAVLLVPETAILFVPKIDSVWVGEDLSMEQWARRYGFPSAFPLHQLDEVLGALSPNTTLFCAPQCPASWTGPKGSGIEAKIAASRVVKTPSEIVILRSVAHISALAHLELIKEMPALHTEWEAESQFLFDSMNCALRQQAYAPIVGSGYSSALLHYTSNQATFDPSEIVLVDAGGEYRGYGSDITRSYPISGPFTDADQVAVYNVVLAAQEAAVAACVEGASWSAVSTLAWKTLLHGLLEEDFVMGGTVEQLYAARVFALFCPHGLGHSVGVDVHDPGSISTLQAGMVLTVEPGVYFNEASFAASPGVSKHLTQRSRDLLKSRFGGVRIEDTILVRAGGEAPENFSRAAPKSIAAIDALRKPKLRTGPLQ